MSGLLPSALAGLMLVAQAFVSALPSEMKTVLEAQVWRDEGSLHIENRGDSSWQHCRVTLNDRYGLTLDGIAAGALAALPLERFASADGLAFPEGREPLYDVFVDCVRAPQGRGIALHQAPDRARMMVIEAQERLATQGYSPGPADGQLGPQTQAAIRAYQTDSGQEPTGQVDAALLHSLRQGAAAD